MRPQTAWPLIGWIKQKTRPYRELVPQARLDRQSRWHDLPHLIGLAHGRLFGKCQIHLAFSRQYAYKFRYLHRGLTQLAGQGQIHYTFALDPILGRKTAIIRYRQAGRNPVAGVIDGSINSWTLSHPDLDLDRIFGNQRRYLFKLKYSAARTKKTREFPSSLTDPDAPPIKALYDQVLDGAFWPDNWLFADARWLRKVRQPHPNASSLDLCAYHTLAQADLGTETPEGRRGLGQRITFMVEVERLAAIHALNIRGGLFIPFFGKEELPDSIHHCAMDGRLPFEQYVDTIRRSKLVYCPPNNYGDIPAERTYRAVELLALGSVMLSPRLDLHFPLEPGVHYVALADDLSNLEEVVLRYRDRPDELRQIRDHVLPLYDRHLSPLAIARHYVDSLRAISANENPPSI